MKAIRIQHFNHYIFVGIATCVMVFLYGSVSYQSPEYSQWDLHDYRTMAMSSPEIAQGLRQPFIYRPFGPFIAGLLPFEVDTNFRVLSICLAVTLSWLFWGYLRYLGIRPSTASLITFFFTANKYLFGFPVWNYFHIDDILAEIELLGLAWSISSRKWTSFGVILMFGALTKETTLLMIPTAAACVAESHPGKNEWRKLLLAVIPASAAAILLRIYVHAEGGNNLVEAFSLYAEKFESPETWFRLLINSFIPLSLVPLISLNSTRKHFATRKYLLLYLILVVLSTFFGHNIERLMAPAAIVFYPLYAFVLEDCTERSFWIDVTMILLAIIASLHSLYARCPLPRNVAIACSIFSLSAVTVLIYYQHAKLRQSRDVQHQDILSG